MRLSVAPDVLSVSRLDGAAPLPDWLPADGFVSVTRTADELSIICESAKVPAGVRTEGGFRRLSVEGPIAFDALGIIAGLSTVLSTAGVSLLTVATFDTDYVLVPEQALDRSVKALRTAGYDVHDERPRAPADSDNGNGWTLASAPRFVRQLAGSGTVGVMVVSLHGSVHEANDTLLRLVGYSHDDVPAGRLDWTSLTAPGYEDADRRAVTELRSRGVATPYEKELLHRDGRRVPVLVVATTCGEEDSPDLAVCFVVDLTERRRAERALRDSERRFRSIADASPLLVWTGGLDGSRTFLNRRWTAFTGRTLEEEQDRGWLAGVHPEDRPKVLRTIETASHGPDRFRMEYRLLRKDGAYRWVLDYGVPFTDDGGEMRGYVGSSLDITERKASERMREDALARERHLRAEAERLSRLKDEFLGTLSHELRTPLNAILGWTQVLRRQRPETLDAGLNVIERNARTLTDLVDDLLDVSRIVAGTIRLEVDRVDVRVLAEEVIGALAAAADARRVTIASKLPPDVGEVTADPARLRQIVWNLLSNAVKFTQAGGRVELRVSKDERALRIVVTDTGEGIAPEFLPYVFDRFSQADGSVSRIHGGLGLGLAIVRHLAELHGGSVFAESGGRGQGARFTVTLPVTGQ